MDIDDDEDSLDKRMKMLRKMRKQMNRDVNKSEKIVEIIRDESTTTGSILTATKNSIEVGEGQNEIQQINKNNNNHSLTQPLSTTPSPISSPKMKKNNNQNINRTSVNVVEKIYSHKTNLEEKKPIVSGTSGNFFFLKDSSEVTIFIF